MTGCGRLAALAIVWLVAAPAVAAEHVTLRAADGTSLAALLWTPAASGRVPAIVLVHMLTRSSADWAPAAERLQLAGFLVLAVDLRGHGGSGGSVDAGGDLSPMLQDVVAALAWVRRRSDVRPDDIGLAGASLGANLALQAASGDTSVRSVALLSAGLEYRGIRSDAAMRKYGDRPALLLAGSNDPYAVRSAKELAEMGPRAQSETLDGAGHGTMMLDKADGLIGRLVDWFNTTLL